MIDPELLDILACPDCKSDVTHKDDKIICSGCGRRYPIKDGIPIMLISESELPVKKIAK
ncbi:MAG: Trm112 family protein [Candidatus Omnitrophota bacterium]